jgi:hypothetical protein
MKKDYVLTMYLGFKAFILLLGAVLCYGTDEGMGLFMMGSIALVLTPLMGLAEHHSKP